MADADKIYHERETLSRIKLDELRKRLSTTREVSDYPELAVFGAGSFARHEASEYSDIDLFVLPNGK